MLQRFNILSPHSLLVKSNLNSIEIPFPIMCILAHVATETSYDLSLIDPSFFKKNIRQTDERVALSQSRFHGVCSQNRAGERAYSPVKVHMCKSLVQGEVIFSRHVQKNVFCYWLLHIGCLHGEGRLRITREIHFANRCQAYSIFLLRFGNIFLSVSTTFHDMQSTFHDGRFKRATTAPVQSVLVDFMLLFYSRSFLLLTGC